MCAGQLLYPKQAGRYLPLSPKSKSFGQPPWTCTTLLLLPTQAGRYLPLKLMVGLVRFELTVSWSQTRRNDQVILQPGVFLGEFKIRLIMFRLLRADRAGDWNVLKALASHPVMASEAAEKSRKPLPLRPLSPGRRYVRHQPIVPCFLG